MQNEMSETFKLYRNAFFHPKGYTKIDNDSIMISYSNDVLEISLNFTIFSVLILYFLFTSCKLPRTLNANFKYFSEQVAYSSRHVCFPGTACCLFISTHFLTYYLLPQKNNKYPRY